MASRGMTRVISKATREIGKSAFQGVKSGVKSGMKNTAKNYIVSTLKSRNRNITSPFSSSLSTNSGISSPIAPVFSPISVPLIQFPAICQCDPTVLRKLESNDGDIIVQCSQCQTGKQYTSTTPISPMFNNPVNMNELMGGQRRRKTRRHKHGRKQTRKQ